MHPPGRPSTRDAVRPARISRVRRSPRGYDAESGEVEAPELSAADRARQAQHHARARPFVMRSPFFENRTQVRFRNRYQPVQTLSPDRADRALADRVGLRVAYRCFEDLKAEPFD